MMEQLYIEALSLPVEDSPLSSHLEALRSCISSLSFHLLSWLELSILFCIAVKYCYSAAL